MSLVKRLSSLFRSRLSGLPDDISKGVVLGRTPCLVATLVSLGRLSYWAGF